MRKQHIIIYGNTWFPEGGDLTHWYGYLFTLKDTDLLSVGHVPIRGVTFDRYGPASVEGWLGQAGPWFNQTHLRPERWNGGPAPSYWQGATASALLYSFEPLRSDRRFYAERLGTCKTQGRTAAAICTAIVLNESEHEQRLATLQLMFNSTERALIARMVKSPALLETSESEAGQLWCGEVAAIVAKM